MTAEQFRSQFSKYSFPKLGYIKIPKIKIPEEDYAALNLAANADSKDYLLALVKRGFTEKLDSGKIPADKRDTYWKQTEFELGEINKLLFTDYILLVYHIIRYCKINGILNSPSRGCLIGDTKVKTLSGYKNLKDITIGDRVFTSNSTFETVLNKFEYPICETLIGLKTFGGTHNLIQMTQDHKVLVLKNPFKEFQNSYGNVLGYKKLDLSEKFQFNNCQWIKACEVQKGDYLVRNIDYTEDSSLVELKKIDLSKYTTEYDNDFVWEEKSFNQYKNKKISIRDIHRQTGLSRNCLRDVLNKRKSLKSTIETLEKYLKTKEESLESFRETKSKYKLKYPRFININEDFCYLFGYFIGDGWIKTKGMEIGFAFHSEDNLKELNKIKEILSKYCLEFRESFSKKRKLIQVIVKSKLFKAVFCELCPNGNTYTKLIPKWMFSLPKNLLNSLAQGLLDSDGSVDLKTGKTSYDSVNEHLIYQVRDLFEIIGYKTSIHKRSHSNHWSDSYKINIYKKCENSSSRAYHDGKRIYAKVSEIVNNISGVNKVYDIKVNNYHDYQTDNFIVHNSCGGSTLLYLIGVIGIDPIKHELLFERFISAARTETKEFDGETYIASESLPDVDIDSDCALKEKLNEFIDSTFPLRTCAIANYGTLQGKVAIKEVCKIFLGYSEEESKQVSDLIEAKFGKVDSITKSLDENEEFQRWANKSPRNKEAAEIAAKLQGLLKNFSVHASGIIITNDPISDTLPTQLTTSKNDVTSVDMGVAQLSGIKIDNLGLKNLSTINETLKLVGKKMTDIDVNDPSIYQFINLKDQFYGVFQAEEGLGKQVLKSIKPTNIEDISVSIALGRPGSMEFVKDYVSYKETQHSELENKYPKEIHYIIKPTGFTIVFQEQVMAISRKMANFTPQESDKLRKVIGKKLVNEMPKWREKFVNQSLANGYKKEQIEFIWEESFLPAANYSFNRCNFEDELVELLNGELKKLKEVEIGDKIKAYNTNSKEDHFVEVIDIYNNGVKKIFSWVFEGGFEIRCTENHKFWNGELMVPIQEAYQNGQPLMTRDGYKFVCFKDNCPDGNTMDLEVAHSDHNYYCNGIVVSNSHSTGYAYLTAVTCYLKANHPLEYFVSMLKNCKNEQDPIGEISKIQAELHHFGIKLLPPHIILSDLDFKIEGPNIRFGLGDIKGIAAKSMQKLLSFRDSKHSSKFEIFESAEKAKLNIGILSSLIQAGTLDDDLAKHKQTRSRLVLEAQVWRLLTVREKRFALHYAPNYNNDLLSVILAFKEEKLKDDKGKEVLKDSRFETIKRDYERYKKIYLQNKSAEEFACWYYERKLLGFPYSSNLRAIFSKKNPNITGVADVVKAKPESKHLFVGIVDEIKSGVSKGKGTRWFRMTVKDEYESYNVLLFNDKIDNCKEVNGELPKEEDVVVVEGTRKSDAVFADFVKIQEHKVYTKLSDLKETEAADEKADKKAKS